MMRHAKSKVVRARGVRTIREDEVECAHDTLHIHPHRPDVTGAAEHFGVGRGCQLCIQKQPDEFHILPSPVLLLQAISLASHLAHLSQGHRCNHRVLGVQHLSCMPNPPPKSASKRVRWWQTVAGETDVAALASQRNQIIGAGSAVGADGEAHTRPWGRHMSSALAPPAIPPGQTA